MACVAEGQYYSTAGSSLLTTEEEAVSKAEKTGYPVLLKATGGGGGIGIYTCPDSDAVRQNFAAAGRQGATLCRSFTAAGHLALHLSHMQQSEDIADLA